MNEWEKDLLPESTVAAPAPPAHMAAPLDDPSRGASFWALLNAGMWDTPERRMGAFAQARFPDMLPTEREALYRQTPQGLAYQAPDTQELYLEEPSGAWPMAQRLAADVLTGFPADVGAGVGSFVGGLPGAVVGGAVGEAGRQLWQALNGEPLDVGSAAQTGLAGAGAGAGDLAVRAGSRVAAGARQAFGRPRYDPARVAQLRQLSDDWGVDLTVPELAGRGDMTNLQSALRDLPQGEGMIDDFLERRTDQIDDALSRYMDELAPAEAPAVTDMATIDVADAVRRGMVDTRRAATEQLYERARAEQADVAQRTLPTMHRLFQDYQGTDIGAQLGKTWRSLFNADGELKTGIAQLHAVKQDLDDGIEAALRAGDRSRARALTMTKNALLEDMAEGSPTYAAANAEFARLSGPINDYDATLLGRNVPPLRDNPQRNVSRVLFGRDSSPQQIARARADILNESGPDTWQSAVRAHLQRTLSALREPATTEQQNLGGMLRKTLFGTPRQRAQLEAALSPEQFQRLDGLMRLLHVTGASFKGQSQTEPRRMISQRIADRSRSVWGKARRPIDTMQQWGESDAFDNTVRNLVDAVLAPAGGRGFNIDKSLRLLEKYGMERIRRDPELKRAVAAGLGAGLGLEFGEYARAEQ